MVPRTFLFIFHAGSRRLGSNSFRNSRYREKTVGSAPVSRLSCLMTMVKDLWELLCENNKRLFVVNYFLTKTSL